MNIKNTSEDYGAIAKWLHWGTAALYLVAYISIYYEIWFTPRRPPAGEIPDTAYWISLQIHLSVGMTLAVLIILRIIWRIINRQPDEEPGTMLEHIASRAGHYALYLILIITPLTGYLGTGNATEFFFMFDIPKFEDIALFAPIVSDGLGMTAEEFEVPIDFLHKEVLGRWFVWILILGHTSAAFYHHFVKKDRTLYKMTTSESHFDSFKGNT